jgi:hypothetical protein
VIAEGQGRAIAFGLAPVRAHELPHAVPLLDQLPGVPKWVVGDRGTLATPFVSTSGIWAHGLRSGLSGMRHPWPARIGTTTTITRGCYGPVVWGFQMKGHDPFAQILPIRRLR